LGNRPKPFRDNDDDDENMIHLEYTHPKETKISYRYRLFDYCGKIMDFWLKTVE